MRYFIQISICLLGCWGTGGFAGTYGDLAGRAVSAQGAPVYIPVAVGPSSYPSGNPMGSGPAGRSGFADGFYPPPSFGYPFATYPMPEYTPYAQAQRLPPPQLQTWSYSQLRTTTNPYFGWGLYTPYLWMPWSTPLTSWSNAVTSEWWRTRALGPTGNW
ncbi:MAG: hypothetical protein ACWA5T_08385 [Parvularcula sp.]